MNVALVLAGGIGTRLGNNIPKQYIKVDNRMIISFCLETILLHKDIDAVQIVADRIWHDDIRYEIEEIERKYADDKKIVMAKFRGFSLPGATRQLSILNALQDITAYAETDAAVLIHDAARPLLSGHQISSCMTALAGHEGVMPVLPMKDTVYMSRDGAVVSELLQRDKIFAGQAPELFLLGKYYDACMALLPDKIININGSTEPAVLAGLDIVMVPGDENNFKITTSADLERFKELMRK